MPFSKYIIKTDKTEDDGVLYDAHEKTDFDDSGIANRRMVNTIRHMSQLLNVADDIFSAIEMEIRDIFNRTKKLNNKIQHCQDIVDNLNAKTAKVPISSLSDTQAAPYFKSSNVEENYNGLIFSRIPRPIAVEKLRNLADGPTSPVVIPCGMVASEVDGFIDGTLSSSDSNSTSTHIYCKPIKIKDASKIPYLEPNVSHSQNKRTNPEEKVSSSIVPIDVSGQTFSRMASFRRSLIHVDFLIRKKKKRDKRRNTVAEGTIKDLKETLETSVTHGIQSTVPKELSSYQHINTESKNKHNYKIHKKQQSDKSSVEQNNNADYIKEAKNNSLTNSMDNLIIQEEKNALNSERQKKEFNLIDSEIFSKQLSSNKKKPKSHIPISTVSAAMNVAVEMRQDNGIKNESNSFNTLCNGYCFDSEGKLQQNKRHSNSSNNEESSQDESWTDYKKRFHDKYKSLADRKEHKRNNVTDIGIETSSSASSENIDPQDTGATTSTESDTFFISSDESDEESSGVYFQEICGSSTSVGTASDGSLNSLLSETGTEMTSSTGTLTSVGNEYLLTPPPPPPPMIISATINDKDMVESLSNSTYTEHNIEAVKNKKNSKADISQNQSRQLKISKLPKSKSVMSQKDNTKNIFNLMSLKTHTKHKNKKDTEKKKLDKSSHQPAFDMYGNNSPVKIKQIPSFIKENYSPVIEKQEKNCMKSFLANDKSKTFTQLPSNEDIDKHKTDFILPKSRDSINSDVSDITKVKETQTMRNIPPKYEHHVTVTPVQRCSNTEQEKMHHEKLFASEKIHNSQHGHLLKSYCTNAENQLQIPQIHKTSTPAILPQQEKLKLAARVVLDFNGKVIYTTNSLDRNHHYPYHAINMQNSAQNKTFKFKDMHSKNYYDSQQENDENKKQAKLFPNFSNNNIDFQENTSHNELIYNFNDKHKNNDLNFKKTASEHECHSSNIKSSHSYNSGISKMFVPMKSDIRPFSYAGPNYLDTYFDDPSNNLLPNPNVSGLPVKESMLTRHNVNLHSKQMEKMNMSNSECKSFKLSNAFCTSSPTSCESILNKSPQSTMSTEDLFAVIHDCKKRMNIKTDSDISLASSSRSCSPSYLRPSSSKGTLAETGFLSPRSQAHLETGGDRRSWADFRPVDSVCYERKSLASDRLGPTKPTSMHDFKMLLLQARTSNQNSRQRKSAVEMLKLPLNQNNGNTTLSLPSTLSPMNPVSSQNSPTYEFNVSNGHSTVPFKRGNRVRTSLQSRYIMYPPIFEDCSEDSEHCDDMISNRIMNVSNIDTMSEKEDANSTHHKINNNACMQNHKEYSCDNEFNTQVK